jgi:hypothetical protein
MDLTERVANVPDAVRLLTKGDRGALAVPVPSSLHVLAMFQEDRRYLYTPESDSKRTSP